MKKIFKLAVSGVLTAALMATSLTAPSNKVSAEQEPKTYTIAFKGEVPANLEEQVRQAGGTVERVIKDIGVVAVKSSHAEFLNQIRGSADVSAADEGVQIELEEDAAPEATAALSPTLPKPDWSNPNQNYHEYQWDIKRVTNDFQSFDLNKGNHEVVVGIVDSGIDFGHPDLKANADEAGSKSFIPGDSSAWDKRGHGTSLAGSIAANGKVMGVGPNLKVRAYRVFKATGGAEDSWITDAIVTAANDGVDVLNLSLGSWNLVAQNGAGSKENATVQAMHRAIQYALKKGVTVVASAGNDSMNTNDIHAFHDYWKTRYGVEVRGPGVMTPAHIPGVINVSASIQWSTEQLAFYSNYGSAVDVSAPGGDNGRVYDQLYRQNPKGNYADKVELTTRCLTTWPTYLAPRSTGAVGYGWSGGTSLAAPKVAGIAALIKSAHPEYSPSQVAAVIRQTAVDLGKTGQDELFGAGEVNAYNALTSK